MYWQVDVVVDGALDVSETITEQAEFNELIEKIIDDAGDGKFTQVYVIEHWHSLDVEECGCVQFLTDHAPMYEFGLVEV